MKTTYTLSKSELEKVIRDHVIQKTKYSGDEKDLKLEFQVGTGMADGQVMAVDIVTID